jgi:hypothetical protein
MPLVSCLAWSWRCHQCIMKCLGVLSDRHGTKELISANEVLCINSLFVCKFSTSREGIYSLQ